MTDRIRRRASGARPGAGRRSDGAREPPRRALDLAAYGLWQTRCYTIGLVAGSRLVGRLPRLAPSGLTRAVSAIARRATHRRRSPVASWARAIAWRSV